jgi:hypothetical protein
VLVFLLFYFWNSKMKVDVWYQVFYVSKKHKILVKILLWLLKIKYCL